MMKSERTKSTGDRRARYEWERKVDRKALEGFLKREAILGTLGLPDGVRIIGVALVHDDNMEGAYVDVADEHAENGQFSMTDWVGLLDVLAGDVVSDINFLVTDNMTDEEVATARRTAGLLGLTLPPGVSDGAEDG